MYIIVDDCTSNFDASRNRRDFRGLFKHLLMLEYTTYQTNTQLEPFGSNLEWLDDDLIPLLSECNFKH